MIATDKLLLPPSAIFFDKVIFHFTLSGGSISLATNLPSKPPSVRSLRYQLSSSLVLSTHRLTDPPSSWHILHLPGLVRILTSGVDRWKSSIPIHRDEKITKKVFQHFSKWIATNVPDSTLSHSKENSQFLSNFLISTFPRYFTGKDTQIRNYRALQMQRCFRLRTCKKRTIIQLHGRISRKFFNKFPTYLEICRIYFSRQFHSAKYRSERLWKDEYAN